MAHRRGSFVRRVSPAQRRKKAWAAFRAFPQSTTSGTVATSIILNFSGNTDGVSNPGVASFGYVFPTGKESGALDAESTLIRIRGSLILDKNVVGATEFEAHAFGIGVMETGAALLGSFPNPASPEGSNWDGWMFYRSISTAVLDAEASIVDVKSMRKIESGYSLIFVAGVHVTTDDDSVPAIAGVNAEFTSRGLFFLP